MTQTTTGWIIFVAAIGMMFSLMAADISALKSWDLAFTPFFIGSIMAKLCGLRIWDCGFGDFQYLGQNNPKSKIRNPK